MSLTLSNVKFSIKENDYRSTNIEFLKVAKTLPTCQPGSHICYDTCVNVLIQYHEIKDNGKVQTCQNHEKTHATNEFVIVV